MTLDQWVNGGFKGGAWRAAICLEALVVRRYSYITQY